MANKKKRKVKKVVSKKSKQPKPKRKEEKSSSVKKNPSTMIGGEKTRKPEQEKNKLVLEYIVHSSPALLFDFLSTPSGLAEWFADDVNISGNIYTFIWDGAKQEAKLLSIREAKLIRFQWLDRSANTYFEFRIEKNEITEELSLIITDFGESEEDKKTLEPLWDSQVHKLLHLIGSAV